MTDNQKKILEMLAENKISADDAYRLLNALDNGESRQENAVNTEPEVKSKYKYLRVTALPNEEHEDATKAARVNVRVPLSLIRAGFKLTSLIPTEAMDKMNFALRDKGINFDMRNIKPEHIEELIEALGDMEVDVLSGPQKVKVFVE